MAQHYLDRLVWDADNWMAEFNALLDAIELQFAIESELGDLADPQQHEDDDHEHE